MHVYAISTDELPGDAVLWRYMSFANFVAMLESSTLFLSSIASVDDEFEGSLPRGNVLLNRAVEELVAPAARQEGSPDGAEFAKRRRRSVVVNCWHRSEHESWAMWRLYAGGLEGVAVRTTVADLGACFLGNPPTWVLPVRYIDFEEDTVDEINDFPRYLVKRKAFEFESEVRAIRFDVPMKDGKIDLSPESYRRPGVRDRIDLDRLIGKVIVAPGARSWFLEFVTEVTARHVPRASVSRSSLDRQPEWV